MKTNKIILITFIALGFVYACNKDIDVQPEISAYTFDIVDANGGTWKPTLAANPEDITVTTPIDVSNAAYTTLVSEMKAAAAAEETKAD